MWNLFGSAIKGILFLLGLVGLVSLPEDAQSWAELMGSFAEYIALSRAEIALFIGVAVFGLWILIPASTPLVREIRQFFKQHNQNEVREALRTDQPRLVLVCRGIERQAADVNQIRFVIKNEDGGATARNLRVTFKLPPDICGADRGRGWIEERIQDTFEPNGRVAVATNMYNEIEGLAAGAYTEEFFGLFIPVESYPNGAKVSLKYRMDAEGMEPIYDQVEATVKLDG